MQRSGSVSSYLKLKSANQGLKTTECRGSEKSYTSRNVSVNHTSILCRTFIFLMRSFILIFEYECSVCDVKILASHTLCHFLPTVSPFCKCHMSNTFVVRGNAG